MSLLRLLLFSLLLLSSYLPCDGSGAQENRSPVGEPCIAQRGGDLAQVSFGVLGRGIFGGFHSTDSKGLGV